MKITFYRKIIKLYSWLFVYYFTILLFHNKNCLYKWFNNVLLPVVKTSLFYLLFNLNYGAIRIYYVLLFILGICSYYLFYYPIVLPIYTKVIHCVKMPIKRFFLVFSQYISIIRMLLKKIKRRLHHVTSNQKKGSKEKT